jgi:uncharacterized metal-binding protein
MTGSCIPDCAACRHARRCADGTGTCDVSRAPAGRAALEAYADPAVLELSREAARIEARGYRVWDRARETVEFARRMGYRRLGLAFCISLAPEAEAFARRLQDEGFEVVSVLCKTGAVPKETLLGLSAADKVCPGQVETMCNPVAQARLLAAASVDLNVVMGLCVGHDTLFYAHAEGPVTCLVVKDRVHDHKPVDGLRQDPWWQA